MIKMSQVSITALLSLMVLCPTVSHSGTTITVSGVTYNLETITSTGTEQDGTEYKGHYLIQGFDGMFLHQEIIIGKSVDYKYHFGKF